MTDLFNIPKKVSWAIVAVDKGNESFLKSLKYEQKIIYTKTGDITHFSFNFNSKQISSHELSKNFIEEIRHDKDKMFLNTEEFKQLLLIQGMN